MLSASFTPSRLRAHRSGIGRWHVLMFATLASGCIDPSVHQDGNAVHMAALLPYTGDMAASGVNLERALMLAAEQVNDNGGVAGHPIEILARNAPDVPRGLAALGSLLAGPPLTAVFGPQVADLYPSIEQVLTEQDLYGVLPTEMAPSAKPGSGDVRWFHLAPRIESVACAMAQTIYNDLHMELVILATDDEYNRSFALALREIYESLTYQGTTPKATLHVFGASEWGTTTNLQSLLPGPEAVIALIAFPRTGATVIQDWAAFRRTDRWYFGPALRANVFVDNTPPGVIEGMKGFSAYIPEQDAERFSTIFAQRWAGDVPLIDAYYYYDALLLSALAMESAAYGQVTIPSSGQVREHIIPTSRGPGTVVEWDDLATGLALVRSGQPVKYMGVSGPVDLTDEGHLESTIETISVWRVAAGKVEPFVKTTCLAE